MVNVKLGHKNKLTVFKMSVTKQKSDSLIEVEATILMLIVSMSNQSGNLLFSDFGCECQ